MADPGNRLPVTNQPQADGPPGDPSSDPTESWLTPWFREHAIRRHWGALRKRWWLVALSVALTLIAAVLYLSSATKVYTAESELLVTPLNHNVSALAGLGLITASSDPTREPATVARMVKTSDIAQEVRARLGLHRGLASLLSGVTAQPLQQGNIVSIRANAEDPVLARQLADAFAAAVVASRTAHLHAVISQALPGLAANARGLPPDDPQVSQLAELQVLRQTPDPTVQILTRAQTPTSPTSPRPLLSLALALLGGGVLGAFGAFALYIFDPRLRDEETLRDRYRLPILARVPVGFKTAERIGFAAHGRALSVAHESFRGLVGRLVASQLRTDGQTVVVSGVSGHEGATTTAIGLSRALANAGHTVILVDANLLHPTVGAMLEERPERGLEDVLTGDVSLSEALVRAMPGVQLLLPIRADRPFARDMLSAREVAHIMTEAADVAEWIVIDAPPVTLAADVLPFATVADHVVVVTRLNHTMLSDLTRLSDVYLQQDIEPAGFVVVGP